MRQVDGSEKVCRLNQTCTPEGADWKYLTTVTDVMILNHAVGLDVARGAQSYTQGVWPSKSPIDSLPLKLLAKSPELMSELSKQPRRNFPSTVAVYMKMSWCNKWFHHKRLASQIPTVTVTSGVSKGSQKVTPR